MSSFGVRVALLLKVYFLFAPQMLWACAVCGSDRNPRYLTLALSFFVLPLSLAALVFFFIYRSQKAKRKLEER